jgi:pimeloyl-ACP methyl ester carboxylesterase
MVVLVQENQVYCHTSDQNFQAELPTLIFIHGAQNNHSVWETPSHYFAHHGYNILAVDLPGHGLSKGKAKTTIEAMAQWLLALMDVVGIHQAVLIGHSMGSLVAMETARIASERVTKLALLGTAYPMKVSDTLLTAARENEPAAIDMVTGWSHHKAAAQEATKQLMQRMSEINPGHLLYTDLSACNNYAHGDSAAAVINQSRCPTLFVLAQQDRMTPGKASAKLRGAIPYAQIIEVAECGHAMLAEQPEAVLAGLAGFLK